MKEMYDAELAAGTSLHTASQLSLASQCCHQINGCTIKPMYTAAHKCLDDV